mmetsp:Transcript_4686/g.11493  ORF Transcript_4686/g.11493 Transcript_4686/m.11493 type:complete len:212 (-) Transcript_4686:1497-2132(-)
MEPRLLRPRHSSTASRHPDPFPALQKSAVLAAFGPEPEQLRKAVQGGEFVRVVLADVDLRDQPGKIRLLDERHRHVGKQIREAVEVEELTLRREVGRVEAREFGDAERGEEGLPLKVGVDPDRRFVVVLVHVGAGEVQKGFVERSPHVVCGFRVRLLDAAPHHMHRVGEIAGQRRFRLQRAGGGREDLDCCVFKVLSPVGSARDAAGFAVR